MTGVLMPKLNDPLAQVCIDHFYAMFMQVFVQPALFRQHALALHHPLNAVAPDDLMDDAVMIRRIRCPVYLHAVGQRVALEFRKIFVEV